MGEEARTMNTADHYRRDHLIAKIIIFLIYLLVGSISIEFGNPYLALSVGTSIWLFGVNTVAYLVECVAGHTHRHHRI